MRLNRRNVLIGLGTVAVGSGAALGSGAFTQVSAERTMNVQAAGDSSAYIELIPEATSFVETSGTGNNSQDILEIDLSSLNDNAETAIRPAFTIRNGLDSGVGVQVQSDAFTGGSEPGGLTIVSNGNTQDLSTYPGGPGDDNNLDASGGGAASEVSVDIVIDTGQLDVSTVSTLTIAASTDEYDT